MAATIEGFATVSEVQGGTKVVKVREWHAHSNPSNVYFQFREGMNITKADAQYTADAYSDVIEAILGNGAVTDMAYSQDVTPSGQLQDVFTTYWTSPDGSETGWVTTPYSRFSEGVVLGQVTNDMG